MSIRAGQERGEIRKLGQHVADGGDSTICETLRGSKDYTTVAELFANGSDCAYTYAVTDSVTDEQYDQLLIAARAPTGQRLTQKAEIGPVIPP